MREIKAIVRNERLDHVLTALQGFGEVNSVVVSWVHAVRGGNSQSPGGPRAYRTTDVVKVEVLASDTVAPSIVDSIREAAGLDIDAESGTITIASVDDVT